MAPQPSGPAPVHRTGHRALLASVRTEGHGIPDAKLVERRPRRFIGVKIMVDPVFAANEASRFVRDEPRNLPANPGLLHSGFHTGIRLDGFQLAFGRPERIPDGDHDVFMRVLLIAHFRNRYFLPAGKNEVQMHLCQITRSPAAQSSLHQYLAGCDLRKMGFEPAEFLAHPRANALSSSKFLYVISGATCMI